MIKIYSSMNSYTTASKPSKGKKQWGQKLIQKKQTVNFFADLEVLESENQSQNDNHQPIQICSKPQISSNCKKPEDDTQLSNKQQGLNKKWKMKTQGSQQTGNNDRWHMKNRRCEDNVNMNKSVIINNEAVIQQQQNDRKDRRRRVTQSSILSDCHRLNYTSTSRSESEHYMIIKVLDRSFQVVCRNLQALTAGLLLIPFYGHQRIDWEYPGNVLSKTYKYQFNSIKSELLSKFKDDQNIYLIENTMIPNFRRIGFLRIKDNKVALPYYLFPAIKYLEDKGMLDKITKIMIPFYDQCDISKLISFGESLINMVKKCPSIIFATNSQIAFLKARQNCNMILRNNVEQ